MALTEASTSNFRQLQVGERNLRIHYNAAGTGEAVLFVHGGGPGAAGWSNFSRNMEAFVEAGYHAIIIDCPGFNKSDAVIVETSRSELHADTIKALLDDLKISKVHLVGNSLGGASSLAFALKYPETLGKLVLMGPASIGVSLFHPMPMEGIKMLMGTYKQQSLEALKRMLDVFVYDPSTLTEELIQGRFENMMRSREHLDNFVTSFERNRFNLLEDYSPRLPQIPHETLVIWGRDDRFVPLDHGLRLAWSMPNADLHVFNKCGHWAQWEHAAKFNAVVLEFLKR